MLLAPLAIVMAFTGFPRWIWLTQAAIAALSDLYDGKLARRWNVVTANLRQADSVADTIYAVAVAISMWLYEPTIVMDHIWGIGLIIFLEAARYPMDWMKFGRGASYHATSARFFGFVLLVAVFLLIGFSLAVPYLWIAIFFGILSEIEGIAISLVLPEWTHDVGHLGKALEIRRQSKRS